MCLIIVFLEHMAEDSENIVTSVDSVLQPIITELTTEKKTSVKKKRIIPKKKKIACFHCARQLNTAFMFSYCRCGDMFCGACAKPSNHNCPTLCSSNKKD